MVSIIIPCRDISEAAECISHCEQLSHPYYEIIVLPDDGVERNGGKVKIIPTGDKLPSHKRDMGIKRSSGDILAFIDADAYPRKDWLCNAVSLLRKRELAGVCGAGLLPLPSPVTEQSADCILRHLPFSYRVQAQAERYVEDYPTFNLIVRKDLVKKVGGFSCNYLTGEDTLLCKKISRLGRILYSPDVIVFHRRRPLFLRFMRQIAIYATHRGFFFRKGIGASRKLVYCLPSTALMLSILIVVLMLLK